MTTAVAFGFWLFQFCQLSNSCIWVLVKCGLGAKVAGKIKHAINHLHDAFFQQDLHTKYSLIYKDTG